MIRIIILVVAFSLSSCATTPRHCPTPPKIGDSESMADYTVRILHLYDECSRS
jgi:hypothetical protein